jgi:hypothetical protein
MADTTTFSDENGNPINTNAPLPRTLSTLDYVFPKEKRKQYQREMDGTHSLRYIHVTDKLSLAAYEKDIAATKLKVLPEGMTPELIAENKAAMEKRAKDLVDQLNGADAKKRDEQHAAERQRAIDEVDRVHKARAAEERDRRAV